MESLFILIIIPAIFALGLYVYYIIFVNKIRAKNKMLGEQTDILTEKFKAEGLDKYYDSLETEELINEHKCILDSFDTYKDDLMKSAEMGCKEKFILDVLETRGIDIDELVKKHLNND